MKLVRFVLLVAVQAITACAGPIPDVPRVQFRLNSPPLPTTVTDNHQEIDNEETNVQVQPPTVVMQPYPDHVATPEATATAAPPRLASPQKESSPAPILLAVPFAEPVLGEIAATELPGMHPLGVPIMGRLDEGQSAGVGIPLEPGRCYSIVGTASTIEDLGLELVLWSSSGADGIVAIQSTGRPAVAGRRSTGCFRHTQPTALPAKVVIKAIHGSGVAFAQVYVD